MKEKDYKRLVGILGAPDESQPQNSAFDKEMLVILKRQRPSLPTGRSIDLGYSDRRLMMRVLDLAAGTTR